MRSPDNYASGFIVALFFCCGAWLVAASISAIAAKCLTTNPPPATLFSIYHPSFFDERPEKIFFASFFVFGPLFAWIGTRYFHTNRPIGALAIVALIGFVFMANQIMRSILGISSEPNWPALAPPLPGRYPWLWLSTGIVYVLCMGYLIGLKRRGVNRDCQHPFRADGRV